MRGVHGDDARPTTHDGTIAAECPDRIDDLRRVSGMGPKLVEKYGAQIVGICSAFGG